MPPNLPNKLAPTTFAEVMEFAKMISDSSFCPKDMKGKPGDIVIAIQLGSEIGLAPIQAMQNIAVINGRPSVWGDAMLALVKGSGLLGEFSEEYDQAKESYTCTSVRRSNGNRAVTTFSKLDAQRAGLWDKPGPWKQYSKRMLQMRARGFNLRDNFPDVLKGLIAREEAIDIPADDDNRPLPLPIDVKPEPKIEVVLEDADISWDGEESKKGGNEELGTRTGAAGDKASPPPAGSPTLTADEQLAIWTECSEKGISDKRLLQIVGETFKVATLADLPQARLPVLATILNKEAKRAGSQARTLEVVDDDDPDDRTLNSAEVDEMMAFTAQRNLPRSELRRILREKFGVNDLGKLRVGYVGLLKAQVEEAGNG